MHLTIKERVELVLMSGADGATNRSVAKKFNRIYPDREHALVRYLRPTLYLDISAKCYKITIWAIVKKNCAKIYCSLKLFGLVCHEINY